MNSARYEESALDTKNITQPLGEEDRLTRRQLQSGATLGNRYHIQEVIGIGGMAIVSLAATLVAYFTIDISNFGVNLNDRLEVGRELEMTLRTMVSEIRSMGPADNGAYDIANATATSFTFFTDEDGDGRFEQIRYFLDGTTLKKGVTHSNGTPAVYPLADEVISEAVHYIVPGAAIFTYYPEGNPASTASLSSPVDVSKIRLVVVRGTVDKDTAKAPLPTTLSITARAGPRDRTKTGPTCRPRGRSRADRR